MPQISTRVYNFSKHDRLRISGQSYRVVSKIAGHFQLQLLSGDILQDHYIKKSDRDISDLLRTGKLGYDRDYFSKTLGFLRQLNDTSDLIDLDEDDLRTIAWKKEWCVRFHRHRLDVRAPYKLTHTQNHLERFIASEKDAMDSWYLHLYGERRPAGRIQKNGLRKPFDYPSASSLRDWLSLYRNSGERVEAFRLGYERCGNRTQLRAEIVDIIDSCVRAYPAKNRFNMNQIYESVLVELTARNASLPERQHLYVSPTAVRRRIRKIDPFIFDVGRTTLDRAIRKYAPVGIGVTAHAPLERVELDDWEMDLQSLMVKTEAWRKMNQSQKDAVTRQRCTVTIAIDVATRCIVGFHMSALPPGSQNARAALRSIMLDKSELAAFGNCQCTWPMDGRPIAVATDGGPAFANADFEETLRLSTVNRIMPNQDPRMRGTIEAFFRFFKKMCRYYTGQTFSNIVERGDYPAEKAASMTFEAIYKDTIRFIVDIYHNRPHRGLEGRTPFNVWKTMAARHKLQPVSNRQLNRAFSYKDARVIEKHGITSLTLSYNSIELALLRARTGRQLVNFYVNPFDLGQILVYVPKEHRHIPEIRQAMEDDDFLVVDCVDGIGKGITLDEHLTVRRELIALAKAGAEKDKVWRLGAHRDLISSGDRARRDAGLDQLPFNQKEYKKFADAVYRNGRAAFSKRRTSHTAAPPETFGEKVSISPNSCLGENREFGERVSIPENKKPKKNNPDSAAPRSVHEQSMPKQPRGFSASANTFKRKPQ